MKIAQWAILAKEPVCRGDIEHAGDPAERERQSREAGEQGARGMEKRYEKSTGRDAPCPCSSK